MNYEYILFKEVFVVISTGIIRKVDKLGRFVLPSELREKFHIVENDALEIFTSGDMIVLKNMKLEIFLQVNQKILLIIRIRRFLLKVSENLLNLPVSRL